MRLNEHVIKKIPLLNSAISFSQIKKGFSFEEKWKVKIHTSEEFFLKIYDLNRMNHAKLVFTYLEHFYQIGAIVPKPVQLIELPEEKIAIQVVESVNGVDGEEYLHTIPKEQQYTLGYQSGKELWKLHTLSNPNVEQTWEEYRLTKYNKYLDLLNESSISFKEIDYITQFVDEYKYLLKGRPIRLLHDDFHPSNLMFSECNLTAVIDFDRFEWGDPYHDFHKMALFTKEISIPFAIGQIDGYFKNEPPEEFWIYYALYAAMIIPSDIIWSYKTTPHLIDSMWHRVKSILEDHDNFKQIKPKWYKKEE